MKKINLENIGNHFFSILILLVGSYGLLSNLCFGLGFPMETIYVFVLLGILEIVLYTMSIHKKSIFQYILIIESAIFIATIFLCGPVLIEMIQNLLIVIERDYFLNFSNLVKTDYNLLFIFVFSLIAIPIIAMMVSVMTQKKRVLLKLFTILIIFVFPLLIKHNLTSLGSYCVVLFLIYGFVFSYTIGYQKNNILTKLIVTVWLVIFMVSGHLFLENSPIFDGNTSDVLTNISHWFDDSRFSELTTGNKIVGASSKVDGSLPTGDIGFNDGIALKVTAFQPMSTYLRGYSLAHYSDNSWHPVTKTLDNENSVSFLSSYISMNVKGSAFHMVTIESTKKLSYQLLPYYTLTTQALIDDSYQISSNQELSVIYEPGQSINNLLKQNNVDSHLKYSQYVLDEYTDVPDKLYSRLYEFIKTNYPKEIIKLESDEFNYEEKVQIVKKILSNQTEYSLNSGQLPSGKDFVEYFLLENKKGSCTHYATTAAMILRSFNVPTRFVSGFVMRESDFHNGTATIKNNRAHTWIEVYYKGYGWFPYEVTPVAEDTGNDANSIGQMLDNVRREQQSNQPQETTPEKPADKVVDIPAQSDDSWLDSISKYSTQIITGVSIVVCLIVYRLISKKLFFIKLRRKSVNKQIIDYYLRLKKLSHFGLAIDSQMRDCVLKAQFSNEQLDDELKYVKDYYQMYNQESYKNLSWYKKFVYKFIFGYI